MNGPTVENAVPTVTFDFHDTIARCDRWFTLEVRELGAAFLAWQARRLGRPEPSGDELDAARDAYRAIRQAVLASGIERDAFACVSAILPGLGVDVSDDEIRTGIDELMRETFDGDVRPIAGAVETVLALTDAGVRLGIVSSAVYTPFLHWTLDRFGITDRFAFVLTSAEAGYYKSHPGIYLDAASRFGVNPGAVVHVGDSFRHDVEGGRRAGLATVWLRGDRDDPDGRPADLTLRTLTGSTASILTLARSVAGTAPAGIGG